MRPYQASSDEAKRIYNYRHCRMRRVVENAFGIMTKKFRIYFKKFNLSPEPLEIIVLATTVLYKFLRNDSCAWQPVHGCGRARGRDGMVDLPRIGAFCSDEASIVRDTFKHYFNCPAGAVSWQQQKISSGRYTQP